LVSSPKNPQVKTKKKMRIVKRIRVKERWFKIVKHRIESLNLWKKSKLLET
jgi:hypothetical protein